MLRLGGEIDIGTAHEIQALLGSAEPGEGGRVAIDLSEVTFIDCRGVALLMQARARAAAADNVLDLVGAADPVHRVIELVAPDLLSEAARDQAPDLVLAR